MSVFLHLSGHVMTLLDTLPAAAPGAGPTPSPSATGAGGVDINTTPIPIPGMGQQMTNWIGYAKTIGIAAGVIGLIICAIMMMIGRRNRSHLAAEGATGVVWVVAGLSVAAMAPGLVSALMGG